MLYKEYKPEIAIIPQSVNDPEVPIVCSGWVSPEGLYFYAEYYTHSDVAHAIVTRYLRVDRFAWYAASWLEDQGWLRIEAEYTQWFDVRPTGQQHNVLWDMYRKASSRGQTPFSLGLYRLLSVTLGSSCTREVFPRVPGQGDQENMRIHIQKRQSEKKAPVLVEYTNKRGQKTMVFQHTLDRLSVVRDIEGNFHYAQASKLVKRKSK